MRLLLSVIVRWNPRSSYPPPVPPHTQTFTSFVIQNDKVHYSCLWLLTTLGLTLFPWNHSFPGSGIPLPLPMASLFPWHASSLGIPLSLHPSSAGIHLSLASLSPWHHSSPGIPLSLTSLFPWHHSSPGIPLPPSSKLQQYHPSSAVNFYRCGDERKTLIQSCNYRRKTTIPIPLSLYSRLVVMSVFIATTTTTTPQWQGYVLSFRFCKSRKVFADSWRTQKVCWGC